MSPIAVRASSPQLEVAATELAQRLHIPRVRAANDDQKYELVLVASKEGLVLEQPSRGIGSGLRVDFERGKTASRRFSAGSLRQPIAKAIGLQKGYRDVIDATAGLGRDAFLLACLGCRVRAIERHAIVAVLLEDGLARAGTSNDPRLVEIIRRIQLISGDARSILPQLPQDQRPEVVYLDTMFGPDSTQALAKKDAQILRAVVSLDTEGCDLLKIARIAATRRVVVKRARRAAPLADNVTVAFPGKSIRYDVYVQMDRFDSQT